MNLTFGGFLLFGPTVRRCRRRCSSMLSAVSAGLTSELRVRRCTLHAKAKQTAKAHAAQLCQTSKTRQKWDWKIRETDVSYISTCTCNYLTSFEYEVQDMTRNGSYLNLQKLAWKICEIVNALSFYRSQIVSCRSKFFGPAQKFGCV